MREWLKTLMSQETALANARRSCTLLSRSRVERDEVEIFFEEFEANTADVVPEQRAESTTETRAAGHS